MARPITNRIPLVLGREMRLLKARGKADFLTDAQFARFLGLTPETLSRLRRGSTKLTEQTAAKIAAALREDDKGEACALAAELLAANKPQSLVQETPVDQWFDWLTANNDGKHQSLIIVEFREPPSVGPDGKSYLAKYVAAAVVRGLSYAMMFPFDLSNEFLPGPVRTYILDVEAKIRATYSKLLEAVMEQSLVMHKALPEAARTRAIVEAAGRLRLYIPSVPDSSPCPIVGHRYFYTEKIDAADSAELWDWISPNGTETMLKVHASPELIESTRLRFYPIYQFYAECSRLPKCDVEIAEFHEEQGQYRECTGMRYAPQWKLGSVRTPEQAVEEFLKRLARREQRNEG